MKKAYTIIRVSGEDQLKGYGPDVQWRYDIVPIAPELGLEVDKSRMRVIQESATGWDRTKWESIVREAMELFRKGEIEALMFPRVDRETRFVAGSFPLLMEVIRSGLEVYFGREKFRLDPNDSESMEKYMNKAIQAQQYVETMKLNTMRGKAICADEGKLPQGTGKGLTGYRWNKVEKKREIIEYEARVIQKIFTMLDEDYLPPKVAETLTAQKVPTKAGGKWDPRTILRIATNPAYIGLTYFGRSRGSKKTTLHPQPKEKWVLLPDVTPPIIDKELFDRVQVKLQRRKELRPGRKENDYLLVGHIVCGHCNSPATGHCLNRRYLYYQCRGAYATYTKPKICNGRYMRARQLEELVWIKIREILEDPQVIEAELTRQIEEQKKQMGNPTLD
ncbi:recombinase family protein [Chloroflexota bacterium]